MKRARKKAPAGARARRAAGSAGRSSNDVLPFEHARLVHELEVHQLELELQNRALLDAQVALEESRARYAELFDYAPVGHLTLDRDGVVRELNVAAASVLGDERRAIVNRPLRLYVAPESLGALDAHIRASRQSRRPLSVELKLRRAGTSAEVAELLTVPPPVHTTSTADGTSLLHAALLDASQRRRDERRHDAFDMRQDFLAVVSHELRSPLAPMLLWVRALRAGGLSEELRKRAVDALDTCLSLQVATIEDLIDVAHGRQGTLRVDLQRMDLARAVRAAVEALTPAAAAKQIELTVDVVPSPLWIAGDAIRLQQVVANLLSNAVAFTREAGRITLSLDVRGANAVLSVGDDGEGIVAARLPHVFEAFHGRDRLAPPHHGGLGLGLAIVRELVARHGGTVAAESGGRGRGSRFTVTIPSLATAAGAPA